MQNRRLHVRTGWSVKGGLSAADTEAQSDDSAICLVGRFWVNQVKLRPPRMGINEPRTIEQNVVDTVD
jgi:hypothetical protein